MAEIPEYQRQNLKSQVVGTPGADFSMGNALDSIAQSAGQISDAAQDLAVKRKVAKDTAVANESILSMDVEMETLWRDHQEQYKTFEGDPAQRAQVFRAGAERQLQERARLAPNEEVRRAIMKSGTDMIQSRTMREMEAADRNQGLIAYTKVNDAQKLSEEEAARIGADENMSFGEKMQRMSELLERSQGTIKAASTVLDPLQTQKLTTESPAGIMKAGATGMLAKKPEELLALLNKKGKDGKTIFDGKLSPQEIEQLRKDATDSVLNFQKRKQADEVSANLDQVTGAFDLSKKGDPVGALAMVEQIADGPLKTNMRQSILREGITEADRIDKVYDLMTKFETLSQDKTSHTKKKKVNMEASLEDLVAFQAEVIEAHSTGDITDAKRNQYLTEFLPELQQKVRQNALNIKAQAPNSQASWLVKTWRAVRNIAPDKTDAVTIHEDFRQRLAQGNDFSEAGVNKALIGALDEHRRVRFPKSMFLAGSTNAVLDHNKSLVATGVEGRTDTPVSGKVPPVSNTKIGRDSEGNKWKVFYDQNGNELRRERA